MAVGVQREATHRHKFTTEIERQLRVRPNRRIESSRIVMIVVCNDLRF